MYSVTIQHFEWFTYLCILSTNKTKHLNIKTCTLLLQTVLMQKMTFL